MFDNQDINIIEDAEGELRVSSLIIAQQTERDHEPVLRLIRDNLSDVEAFGRVSFENGPFVTAGGMQTKTYALLSEQQATLLITFMRNTDVVRAFKVALIKEFYRMRQALTKPALTDDQIVHQALTILTAKTAQLEAKVAEDAPKVDYVETFVADDDLRLIRNVAKSLGMGEQQLRTDLIARKWIYEEKSTRWSEKEQKKVPHNRYSAYADKTRYFTPVPAHDAPRFRGEVMHTLKVTPDGAVAIARLYGRHLQAVEAVAS